MIPSKPISVPKPIEVVAARVPAEAGGLPAAPAEMGERWHVVVRGDTLSGLAKQYYGKASLYMRIFDANKDQLTDPNLIKVGQKLRIPQ